VQTVVPVSGLLGETAATLREREFDALASLARQPIEATTAALTSADRFVDTRLPDVDRDLRRALLDRLGLFGLRSSVALIQHGVVSDSAGLSARLLEASGVLDLHELLISRFAARRDVVKAQHALHVVESALADRSVAEAADLRGRLDDIVATTHDLAELRLLNDLATGDVPVEGAVRDRLATILGASGFAPAQRLGLADGDAGAVAEAALVELRYWSGAAAGPLAPAAQQRAARVAMRTCERLLQGGSRLS
jgi:hypothetical protein